MFGCIHNLKQNSLLFCLSIFKFLLCLFINSQPFGSMFWCLNVQRLEINSMAEAKISEPENSNVNSPKWHPKIKKKKAGGKEKEHGIIGLCYNIRWPVAATAAKSLQSCPTLCDPIDGSPPRSPVPGILQARTLEWVAISFSNAWKWKVKGKSLSRVRLLATPWTAAHQAPPSMGFFQARVPEWVAIAFSDQVA